jgi:hypothetical protein
MTIHRRLAIAAAFTAVGWASLSHAHAQKEAPVGPPKLGRWSGNIRTSLVTVSNSGNAEQTRYSGKVDVAPSENGREGVMKLEVRLSSNKGSEALEWAMSPGRCGSPLLPLVPPSEVPPLEVRPGGDADLRYEGPLNMTANGTYHFDVLRNGHSQANIVACADVKYQKPDK